MVHKTVTTQRNTQLQHSATHSHNTHSHNTAQYRPEHPSDANSAAPHNTNKTPNPSIPLLSLNPAFPQSLNPSLTPPNFHPFHQPQSPPVLSVGIIPSQA